MSQPVSIHESTRVDTRASIRVDTKANSFKLGEPFPPRDVLIIDHSSVKINIILAFERRANKQFYIMKNYQEKNQKNSIDLKITSESYHFNQ